MIDAAPYVPGSPTSEAAAESIKPHTCRLRMEVLRTITATGGLTDEIGSSYSGIAANTWRPRRRELQVLGMIRDSGETRPTKSGRKAVVWKVTTEGLHTLSEYGETLNPRSTENERVQDALEVANG